MNDVLFRIRKVFKDSKKSQTEIGKMISKTSQYVWKLLNDDNANPSDSVIKDICREFNINEEWIRFGIEPRTKQPDDEIAEIVDNILTEDTPLYSLIKGILKTYNAADEKSKQCLENFAESLVANLKNSDFSTTPTTRNNEAAIEERVDAYRDFLETKEKATKKLSS